MKGGGGLRRIAATLAALAVLLAVPTTAFAAPTFPALEGRRVVDEAGVLSPAVEASLTGKLENLESATGRHLVIATLPSLQGYEIEDYGYRLGRHWGVGSKARDDGVLLIVAPRERKVRIEVGYGLEGTLTDALARIIIDTRILPKFRDGDLEGGVVDGSDAIVQQLSLPEDQARTALEDAARTAPEGDGPWWIKPLVGFLVSMVVTVIIPILWGGFSGLLGFGGYRPGEIRRRSGGIVDWNGGSFGGGSPSGGGYSGGGGSFGGGGASGSW